MRLRRPTTVTTAVLTATLTATALVGCSADAGESTSATTSDAASATTASTAVAGLTPEEAMAANAEPHASGADDEDLTWDESEEVALSLEGDSAQADGDGVTVDGSTVTITQAGTYRVTGELTDGQIVVASSGDGVVRLVLDGASVTSSTTSALVVDDAASAVVVLADGSTNHLEATGAAADADGDGSTDEPDGALFSTADLTIGGSGSLDVVSASTDGIVSKDGLVVAGGTLTVDAGDDGIRGKDYLVVTDDASITVTAAADGLKSTNADDETMGYVALLGGTVDITSGDDGIQAETDAIVADASVTIAAAGGVGAEVAEDASAKGIKGDVGVVVGGSADVSVDAADDGLHSNGAVSVSGGEITLASGDDGVHADGDLTVSDGTLTVTESVEGLEGATITLAGGDIDITSSDDGVNAAGGTSTTSDTAGTTQEGTAPQEAPAGDGEMPDDFTPPADGEMPAMPDGAAPGDGTAGEPPAMPDGEMPDGTAPGGQAGGQGGGPGDESAETGDYWLKITGGTLVVDAGGDGLDSNGTIEITGGTTVVQGPTNAGNGALDTAGAFTISGGTLLAAGSSGMAVAPDTDSSQGWVAANLDQTAAAGTVVHLLSDDGTTLVSYEVTKDTENIVYSSPEITTGATYVFQAGGTLGSADATGLSSDGSSDGATQVATATAGEFAGGGMGGMGGGGRRPGATDSTDTTGEATTSGT